MKDATLLCAVLIALAGCGDDGRHGGGGGDDDTSGEDGSSGSSFTGDPGGNEPTGGFDYDDEEDDDDEPAGTGAGSGSSSGSTSGSTAGDPGTTCAEIWECYESCSDVDCTNACYDAGSDEAKAKDTALWRCIFVHDCKTNGCIDENCAAEKQACLEQG